MSISVHDATHGGRCGGGRQRLSKWHKPRTLLGYIAVIVLTVAMMVGPSARKPADAAPGSHLEGPTGTYQLVAHVRLDPARSPYPLSGKSAVGAVHICAGSYDEKTGTETLTYYGAAPPSSCTVKVMVQSTWWYTYGPGAVPAKGCELVFHESDEATCALPAGRRYGNPPPVIDTGWTSLSSLGAAYHLPVSSVCVRSATAAAYYCVHYSPTPYPPGALSRGDGAS